MAGAPRRSPSPERDELTVDELAARVGMTVRNVRAYAARGLLPPPRLVGRTGWYGPDHVARLVLVRQLLAEGYTLAAVEKAIDNEPGAASAGSLALHRALMAPWAPDAPQETDVETIASRAGSDDLAQVAEVVEVLAGMGVVEELGGGRLRVLDPALLDAGVRGVRLGLSATALVAVQLQVVELVEQAAGLYVQMFRDTVWQDHLDAGAPSEGWPAVQAIVEGLPPVAAQAVLASFRSAMASAVASAVETDLAAWVGDPPDDAA